MKSILAALLVLCVCSQAYGATKAKPPQLKPIPRATLNKIAAEFATVHQFQTRPAAPSLSLNKKLAMLVQPQRPVLIADPYFFLGKRHTLFQLAAMQQPQATYWQVGCGKLSFGRIYQGRNSYLMLSGGLGLTPCSYQQGKYTTGETIQPGLYLGGTLGGGSHVANVSFASYTTTGFHHSFSDGFKVESSGKGSPQAGVALTGILRTQ